jgi:hypothetical protein
MISYQKRFLHRGSWYTVILEKEDVNKCDCDHCKKLLHSSHSMKGAVLAVPPFPESPVNLFRYIYIIYHRKSQQKAVISDPDYARRNIIAAIAKHDIFPMQEFIHFKSLFKRVKV